jgi:outer membrane protein
MLKNKSTIFLTLFIIGIITYLAFTHKPERKVGYVQIKELYNGFELKKQMEQKYIQAKQKGDKTLDAMKFELNKLLKQIDAEKEKNPKTIEEFKKKKEEFYQTKSTVEEENTKLSKQYDEQILTQLNQYVKDYGIAQHYDLLFGADESGTLMFATEEMNRTKEVLEYINAKYNGAK